MSTLGRPKRSKNHQIVTVIIESDDITTIDEMAEETGTSRSAIIRDFINVGLQLYEKRKKPESLIILRQDDEDEWVSLDPELGIKLQGKGTGPEEALDSFLTAEESFLEAVRDQYIVETHKQEDPDV